MDRSFTGFAAGCSIETVKNGAINTERDRRKSDFAIKSPFSLSDQSTKANADQSEELKSMSYSNIKQI